MSAPHLLQYSEAVSKKNFFKCLALIMVGVVTILFIIAELVVFVRSRSLVVLADAISNIFDLASVSVAFWAITNSVKTAPYAMSYGWKRTEIVGATINSSALTAVCLFIFLDAIPNFIFPQSLEVDMLYLTVAAIGILVHGFGVALIVLAMKFSHAVVNRHVEPSVDLESNVNNIATLESGPHSDYEQESGNTSVSTEMTESDGMTSSEHSSESRRATKKASSFWNSDLNMKAVVACYAADTIGSVLVLITGLLVFFYTPRTWTHYLDPTASTIYAGILLYLAIPLVKSCGKLLLHSTPDIVPLHLVNQDLLNICHVTEVHDLHVWQLNDSLIVATVHLRVRPCAAPNLILHTARAIFHRNHIHSSTVQLESETVSSVDTHQVGSIPNCLQNCVDGCRHDWCCQGITRRPPGSPKP